MIRWFELSWHKVPVEESVGKIFILILLVIYTYKSKSLRLNFFVIKLFKCLNFIDNFLRKNYEIFVLIQISLTLNYNVIIK